MRTGSCGWRYLHLSLRRQRQMCIRDRVTSSTKSSVKGHPFSAHLSSKIPKSVVSPQGEQVSLSSTAAVNATSVNIVAPLPPEIAPTTTTSAQTTPSFIPSKIPYVKPTSTLGDYMPSQKPDKPNVPIAEMQIKPQVSSYKPRKLPDNTAQSLSFRGLYEETCGLICISAIGTFGLSGF